MKKINEDAIQITEKDYHRILHAIKVMKLDTLENLELELERANIIADNEVPPGLVTMNSLVKYQIVQDEKNETVTIVYPSSANLDEKKISIFAPLGTALLGLSVGQKINWAFPDGKVKTIKIEEVLYQPEASGDWHL